MVSDEAEFKSPEQLAGAAAAALAEASAHQAFKLFENKEYRRLARFNALVTVEQDRIFNELVVAHLVLIMLVLEAPDLRVQPEFRDHLARLKEQLPKAYVDNLGSLGVEDEHLRMWEELISLRYEEYAKDRHDVRSAAMHLEAREKPLDLDDLSRIQLLVPVQAVAIGCHRHVCRGETDGRDELFKLALNALASFYADVRIRLEGGTITFGMRARRFLRRAR
jgi:hypothetical protein